MDSTEPNAWDQLRMSIRAASQRVRVTNTIGWVMRGQPRAAMNELRTMDDAELAQFAELGATIMAMASAERTDRQARALLSTVEQGSADGPQGT